MSPKFLLPLLASTLAWASFEGMATQFNGIGFPAGACGVPDSVAWYEAGLDTSSGQGNPFYYVALNVFNTPGNYSSPSSFGPRPLPASDSAIIGTYNNGHNCGRWIKVSFGDHCDGTNDGAQNQPFCRGGTGWAPDNLNGASLDVVVSDQCSDNNAWCRDSKYHLDIHTPSLNHFELNGVTIAPLATNPQQVAGEKPLVKSYDVSPQFGNRKVIWDFEPAPNYRGEPRFYFFQGAKPYYYVILVTHLPNGIHSVEQWIGGKWKTAGMAADAGQKWQLDDTGTFVVRLRDVNDQLVMGGRSWSFNYPKACGGSCYSGATPVDNLVGSGGDTPIQFASGRTVSLVQRNGRQFLFPGASGAVEIRALDGHIVGVLDARGGNASWAAPHPGLFLARIQTASGMQSQSLFVP